MIKGERSQVEKDIDEENQTSSPYYSEKLAIYKETGKIGEQYFKNIKQIQKFDSVFYRNLFVEISFLIDEIALKNDEGVNFLSKTYTIYISRFENVSFPDPLWNKIYNFWNLQ